MMIRRTSLRSGQVHWGRLLLLAGMLLLPACSNSFDDHPPVYPVKGKVNFQRETDERRNDHFRVRRKGQRCSQRPSGGPFRVTGKINNEGTFNLVAYTGSEGMPAGNYKVGILAVQGRSESNLFNRKVIMPKKAGLLSPVTSMPILKRQV